MNFVNLYFKHGREYVISKYRPIIIISVYVRCFWNCGAVTELDLNIPKTPVWFRTKAENILKETFIFHFLLFDIT